MRLVGNGPELNRVRVATEHVLNGVDVLALLAGLRMIRTSATGISGVKINLVVPTYRLRSRDDPYVAVSNNFVPRRDFFAARFTCLYLQVIHTSTPYTVVDRGAGMT